MNKTALINSIAKKSELSKKDAEKALKAFEEVVTETLVSGDRVQLVGFMTMKIKEVTERNCRNPKDGSTVVVPAHKKVSVKIGKALKDLINV